MILGADGVKRVVLRVAASAGRASPKQPGKAGESFRLVRRGGLDYFPALWA